MKDQACFKVQRISHPNNGGMAPDGPAPRVETGAVQFGNDWPGLFLRGDDAFALAMHIKQLGVFLNSIPDKIKVEDGGAELALAYMRLRNLQEMILEDVVVGPVKESRNEDGAGTTR